MSEKYIEEIFIEFYDSVIFHKSLVQNSDRSPLVSFYNILIQGQRVTASQGKFIINLLVKYKNVFPTIIPDDVEQCSWEKEFRTIDTSRKVFVEQDEHGKYWVALKFPYPLKNIFEKDILGDGRYYYGENLWDKDRRLRLVNLLDYNIIKIYDFVKAHNFEIDETFFDACATVEEIWQNQNSVIPHSTVIDGVVELVNATESAKDYFDKNKTNSTATDLFLAKSMHFCLNDYSKSVVEKIASSIKNQFWINNFKNFFELTESIEGQVVIILDRSSDIDEWIKKFTSSLDSHNIDRNNVRVCFRTNKTEQDFNEWVKELGYTGKIDGQKYLICLQKPPKWLFKQENSVKILATNSIFHNANRVTKAWLQSHPCVIYISEIEPSIKDLEIVNM